MGICFSWVLSPSFFAVTLRLHEKGTAIFPGWLFPFVYCVAGVDAYVVEVDAYRFQAKNLLWLNCRSRFFYRLKGLACKSFFPFFHFFCRLRKRQLLPSILPHSNQGRILGRSSHFQLFGCFRPAQPTGGILQPRFFSVAHVTKVPVTGIDGRIDCSAWRLWICCIVSHLCDFCQMGKALTPANTAR